MQLPTYLEKRLEENRPFRYSDYMSEGTALPFKSPWLFLGFTLVYLLVNLMVSIVPIVGDLLTSILSGIALAGVGFVSYKLLRGESITFEDFFIGFQHLKPLALVSLAVAAPFFLTGLVLGYLGYASFLTGMTDGLLMVESVTILILLLSFIPAMILALLWSYAPLFVVFHKLEPWPALEASRRLALKHPFLLFLLLLVAALVAALGILILIIGILWTMHFLSTTLYCAFADQIGFAPEEGGGLAIEDHFVVD